MHQSVSIRNLNILYLEKGKGDPFVLLHGFSFYTETWVEINLFDKLSREYHVYSFDMPYGIKSRSDKFDVENRNEYAVFLDNLLKTLGINEPILLGASISGEVALRYLSNGYTAKAGIVVGPVNLKTFADRLNRITIPILGIWGERDNISSPENSKFLTDNIKNAEVRLLSGTGHACYLDKPEEFKMILEDYLKRLSI
ncbi:MAG: alpha/beta hydrolase [Nitrospirae bacterium]|nr:alpha/beta hydrolase [Nitrospirota bacterium]